MAMDMVQGRPDSGLGQVGDDEGGDHLLDTVAPFQKNNVSLKAHSLRVLPCMNWP